MTSWLGRFLTSSIGRKYVMAVTGLSLVLFLLVHLAGNLTLYISDAAFNGYAAALEANPLLPLAELGLAALFGVHSAMAFWLTILNRRARKDGYRSQLGVGRKTLASTTMAVTGPLVLVFVLIHVWDFRVQKFLDHELDLALAVRDRLASPVGASIYMFFMVVLLLHLWHAFQSSFQTFGLGHDRWRNVVLWAGRALAVVLFVGFLSFPVWLFILKG